MSSPTPSTSSQPKRSKLNDFHSFWVRDTDPPPPEEQPEGGQVGPGSCQVCGGVSSRRYFGVAICTSCRAFFQTHKSSPTPIRCRSDFRQQCELVARKKAAVKVMCQYCRFKKCVDVGLDMNSGRFPRIVLEATTLYTNPFLPKLRDTYTASEQDAESNEMVYSLLELFHEQCPYTSGKVAGMVEDFFPYTIKTNLDRDANRLEIWERLTGYLSKDVTTTIDWLPTEPIGDVDDICTVLRRQLFPMMVIQWTRASTVEHGLRLHDGTILGYQKMRMAFGVGLAENLIHFASDLRAREYTDEELMIFTCLIFLQPIQAADPHRAQLNNPGAFEEQFNLYYGYFMKYLMACQLPTDKLKYGMAQMMPHLNAISELFHKEVQPFLIRNKEHFCKNLFYDMFIVSNNAPRPPVPPPRLQVHVPGVGQVAHKDHVAQGAQNAQNGQGPHQVAHQGAQNVAHQVAHPVAQQVVEVAHAPDDDDSDIEFIEEVQGNPEKAPEPKKPNRKRNRRKSTPEN